MVLIVTLVELSYNKRIKADVIGAFILNDRVNTNSRRGISSRDDTNCSILVITFRIYDILSEEPSFWSLDKKKQFY